MRRLLERYQDRLREDEQRKLREGLRRSLEPEALPRDASVRRWSFSFAIAAALVLIAGMFLTRLDLGGDRLRLPRWRVLGSRVWLQRPAAPLPVAVEAPRSDRPAALAGTMGDPFTDSGDDSLSTFALAVSDSSYLETRRELEAGALPDPERVRVEEFLRFFRQDYPPFEQPGVRVFLEGAPSPFTAGAELLRVGVRARGNASGTRDAAGPIVAEEARIEVLFHPELVERYRLIGFENRAGSEGNGSPGGADLRAGQEAIALYEIKLRGPLIPGRIATATVRYSPCDESGKAGALQVEEQSIGTSDFAISFDSASPRFRLDAAVARFAEILRFGHGWTGDRLAVLLPMAGRLSFELRDPAVAELAALVRRAEEIADTAVR